MIREAVISLQQQPRDRAARRGLCDALHAILRTELLAFAAERPTTDATQEALVDLFSVAIRKTEAGEIDLTRSDEELKAYFKKISINALKDARRREQLRLQRQSQLLNSDRPDEREAPADAVVADESRTHLTDAISRLGADEQTALRFWLAGLTGREIAARLGVTSGTARSRVHRAKLALRDFIDA